MTRARLLRAHRCNCDQCRADAPLWREPCLVGTAAGLAVALFAAKIIDLAIGGAGIAAAFGL